LRYISELRLGDRYSVRVRFLSRTAKAIHVTGYLVNESRDTLANVMEVVSIHVNQETRRPTDIPDDVAAELDARITLGDGFGWPHMPRLAPRRA
jgi:acyl-CoA thioester hydrolase